MPLPDEQPSKPTEGQSKAEKAERTLVNVVNPRLGDYTRGACIALIVIITQVGVLVALTVIFQIDPTTTVTKTTDRPAVYGSYVAHHNFIEDMLNRNGVVKETHSEVETQVTVCLKETFDSKINEHGAQPFLAEDGCHPPWLKCHDDFPYDQNSDITPRNMFCIPAEAYGACPNGGANLKANLGLFDLTESKCIPKIEWCGDQKTQLQRRHYYSYRWAWHTSHTCVCGGDANSATVENKPWDCNEWDVHRKMCSPGDESQPGTDKANLRICGYDPNNIYDTASVPFRATYEVEQQVTTKLYSKLMVSLGSAYGWSLQVEVVLTVLLLCFFVQLGISKRKDGGRNILSTIVAEAAEATV